MASREDAMFDENKYYFPQGAAKVRDERIQQPWLEVSTERDEQGTPGLQLVPDEQKYIGARDDHKGLYGDCRIPELALCPGQALGPPAATHGNASAHHGDNVLSSQITPWSQPATIDSPRHWSEPLATPKPQQVQPVPPGQQQQYVQIVPAEQSCESTYPTTHQPQHSWPEPEASSQQPQWAQSTTTLAPHNYAEQIYWAPQVDHTNQLVPSAPNLGQHSYSSLEVSSQYSDGHASSWTHGTDTGPTLAGSLEVPLMKTNMKTNPSKRYITGSYESRKLMWWILGILMGMLIVIGAVVGGVLGSRAAHVQTESDTPITLGSNSTTTLETIRQNSRLAVTGYRGDNGNYTLRLFFQDPENRIRFMDKSSVGGKWTDPVTLDTLDFEPMPNGSITASSYLGSDPQMIELFYLDTTSTIRGQTFNFWNDRKPIKGEKSSINDYPLQVAENSSVSCYFPYIVSQDKDNDQIRWTKMLGQNTNNLTQPWWTNDTSVNTLGSQQTGLVLLPVAQTYIGGGGFTYRSTAGTLAVAMKDYTGNATASASWNEGTLSTPIPSDSAIGAFVVGRPYTPESVNTYILYQDNGGVVQVVWQDGDEWQGPDTSDALSDASIGTDIECLTQGAWDSGGVQISREQDMNRCFFQEKDTGRLKEVWFDGDRWRDQGFVPLD